MVTVPIIDYNGGMTSGKLPGTGTGGEGGRDAEARRGFERVIGADDAGPRRKARAWIGLGRMEEEPARRRRCLESALALDPGNPEARRELAILDGRLDPADIVDPDRPVAPVLPESAPAPGDIRRLACPKCGARLTVLSGTSACAWCGQPLEGISPPGSDPVGERDFAAALPTARARRWELPTERTLRCEGCGGSFVLPPGIAGGACPFCRSTHVIRGSDEGLIRPDSLIPFVIDAAEARRRIRYWMEAERFRPADLPGRAGAVEPRPFFLPFWTFDLGGTTGWRALVARGHGKRREWVPETGVHLLYQDDLIVPAGTAIPDPLAGAYADFDTGALIPYAAEHLAGCATEIGRLPLAAASIEARRRALERAEEYERKTTLAGRSFRDFTMNSLGMSVDSYRLVLLPFWLASYGYGGRGCPVAVNGQTGTVAGTVPRTRWQRALSAVFGPRAV